MFDVVGDGIWTHRARYRFGALVFPHAVTVMRMRGGSILVHSPASLDDATRDALTKLGSVGSIVWPSWWHDLHLREWADAFPDAVSYVAPDLRRAVAGRTNARVLSDGLDIDADIFVAAVDRLGVWFDEYVLLHRPSKTLVVADLVVSVDLASLPFPTNVFFSLMGTRPGPKIPWYYPLIARDRARLRAQLDRIASLDFDKLIVGHGDVVTSDARAVFAAAVDRLLPPR